MSMIDLNLLFKCNLQESYFWTCLGSFNEHSATATLPVISTLAQALSCSHGDGFKWEDGGLLGQPFPIQGPSDVHKWSLEEKINASSRFSSKMYFILNTYEKY